MVLRKADLRVRGMRGKQVKYRRGMIWRPELGQRVVVLRSQRTKGIAGETGIVQLEGVCVVLIGGERYAVRPHDLAPAEGPSRSV